jgi:DNA repair protein RadC
MKLPQRPAKLRFVVQSGPALYGKKPEVDTPEKLSDYWKTYVETDETIETEKENLIVILLDTHLCAIGHHVVSTGTNNECPAHVKDILCPAVCARAYGFAVMHNHPSGQSDPSRGDEMVTRKLVDASVIMGIRFIDHVIYAGERYYSFRESGLIR